MGDRLERLLLKAVALEPGLDALTIQAEVRRDALASRGSVSRATAHLVAHGKLLLDGEHRLWPQHG